ncbi:MAG: methyltransferase [Planctomycetaceae bacterium]|nr:methyltransferase [Planctomycetaceae bacterium]MBP60873.1 methyltransferase [Planctomycetaceae bacterium]
MIKPQGMPDTKQSVELGEVQETLLLPLYLRARESRRGDAIIRDPVAERIIEELQYDFDSCDRAWRLQLDVAIRTEILDEQTKKFIDQNPEAVVVNLGAGLDNRFTRLDNGRLLWIDLDMPDTIALRRKFFVESERNRFLAKSMFDFTWIDDIARCEGRPLLLIAEGLVHYFEESQMKEFFGNVADRLPGAEFLMHSISPVLVNRQGIVKGLNRMNAQFKWGIWSGREIEAWDPRYQFIEEWSFFDRYRERWRWTGWIAQMPPFSRWLRGTLKIVHFRFRGG